MIITLNTSSKTFRYAFTLSLLVFAVILFATATYSWTGPASSPPNSNVAAPINTSATSQVKSGALSVNGLSVYGNEYISGYLGIGSSPSAPWRIYAPGSQYGIYATATNGQAIRGASTAGGYAGYFVGGGGGGGVYAQNSGGYYAFLGYPGSSWSVYGNGPTYTASYSRADGGFVGSASGGYGGYFTGYGGVYAKNTSGYYAYLGYPGTAWSFYGNGNTYTAGYSRADGGFCIGGSCITSWPTAATTQWHTTDSTWIRANGNKKVYTSNQIRADGGFCIAGSCRTSWGAMGGSYWTGWVSIGAPGTAQTLSCASGYVVTAIGHESQGFYQGSIRLLCTSVAP